MPPEELPKFYKALVVGTTRSSPTAYDSVYPMEEHAMQFLNLCANKFFGVAFTWLLGQTVQDTLCGTKVRCTGATTKKSLPTARTSAISIRSAILICSLARTSSTSKSPIFPSTTASARMDRPTFSVGATGGCLLRMMAFAAEETEVRLAPDTRRDEKSLDQVAAALAEPASMVAARTQAQVWGSRLRAPTFRPLAGAAFAPVRIDGGGRPEISGGSRSSRGMTIVDIGANQGLYTLLFRPAGRRKWPGVGVRARRHAARGAEGKRR